MVIEKILKQLSPKKTRQELKEIQKIKLSPKLLKWIKTYEEFGERNRFLWKWMYKAVQVVTVPVVPKKYEKSIWRVRTLMIMFITLLDDIADKTANRVFLNELLKIPFEQKNMNLSKLSDKEKRYLFLTKRLWNYLKRNIKKFPRYQEFKEVFEYDFAQVLNAMRYSQLVNKTSNLINTTEYWQYLPYNMQGIVSYTIDLMVSPTFKNKHLGTLREMAWLLQKMSKIGNWVSTWEREVKENDFTSGVIAYALDGRAITTDELTLANATNLIKKIRKSQVEKKLLEEWEKSYYQIKKINKKTRRVNGKKILVGAEKFLILHLIAKGFI